MNRELSDFDLIERLRRAASIWFKNDDLLLLEELIRRYRRESKYVEPREPPVK